MLGLEILRTGYIYPKVQRPIRDLLRERSRLVRQRTAQILSVQNIIARNTGRCLSWSKIEELTSEEMEKMLADEVIRMAARASLEVIKRLDEQIGLIQKTVKEKAKLSQQQQFPVNRIDPLGLDDGPDDPPVIHLCSVGFHYDFWAGKCIPDGYVVSPGWAEDWHLGTLWGRMADPLATGISEPDLGAIGAAAEDLARKVKLPDGIREPAERIEPAR